MKSDVIKVKSKKERAVLAKGNPFPTEPGSFDIILVIYKLPDADGWKGFAYPYGETTEGKTKQKTLKQMRALAKGYKSTLEEYNNPAHLVHGGLGNVMDREVFSWVLENLNKELRAKGKADAEECYAEIHRD